MSAKVELVSDSESKENLQDDGEGDEGDDQKESEQIRYKVCRALSNCKRPDCNYAHTKGEFQPSDCKFNEKCFANAKGLICSRLHKDQTSDELFEEIVRYFSVRSSEKPKDTRIVIRNKLGIFNPTHYRFSKCFYGDDCKNKKTCRYYHSSQDRTPSHELFYRSTVCPFSIHCSLGVRCHKAHSEVEILPVLCKYGSQCKRDECDRHHPTDKLPSKKELFEFACNINSV